VERKFLVHKLGEAFKSADITEVKGIKAYVLPNEDFASWESLQRYFTAMGATPGALAFCAEEISKHGSGHLTIADVIE
jgi:hypothetical protein